MTALDLSRMSPHEHYFELEVYDALATGHG